MKILGMHKIVVDKGPCAPQKLRSPMHPKGLDLLREALLQKLNFGEAVHGSSIVFVLKVVVDQCQKGRLIAIDLQPQVVAGTLIEPVALIARKTRRILPIEAEGQVAPPKLVIALPQNPGIGCTKVEARLPTLAARLVLLLRLAEYAWFCTR